MRWIPRPRFRLLTLLIALTALCVWLGTVVDRAHKQIRAMDAVQRLGGAVLFNYHYVDGDGTLSGQVDLGRQPTAPGWARKLIGDEYFRTVVGLAVDNDDRPPDAADLEAICAVRPLKLLFVKQPTLTDQGLGLISTLPKLKVLNIGSSAVTDEGLRSLARSRHLTSLTLRQTSITDAGLSHLRAIGSLAQLDLSRTAITGPGLAYLSEMESLEELSLAETQIGDGCLPHLQRLRGLRELDLWRTSLTNTAVEQLQASLPGCRIVWAR